MNEKEAMNALVSTLEASEGLSAAELAETTSTPLLLARERLLLAEKKGLAVRDESLEGLRFYPNLFFSRRDAPQ